MDFNAFDLISVLNTLTLLKEFDFNDAHRNHFFSAKKQFIVLTDVDAQENAVEFIALNFDFLANFSTSIEDQIHQSFSGELGKIPIDLIYGFQPSILKTCREIDLYYLNLEKSKS